MFLSLALSAFAAEFAHDEFQAVLDARLSGGRVDYAGLKREPAALDRYLARLAAAPVASLSPAERKALWVNAYNACTLDVVADRWPLASIQDVDGGKVWDRPTCDVGGTVWTLNQIEHEKLRPLGDARVHAALNCASLGCPPLAEKVFTGPGLDGQLDAASRRWAAQARFEGDALVLSRIFDWYGDDFVGKYAAFDVPGLSGKEEAAANFVAAYAPGLAPRIHQGGYRVRWAEYDWAVNAR